MMNHRYTFLLPQFRNLGCLLLCLMAFTGFGQLPRKEEVIISVGRSAFPSFVNGITVEQIDRMDGLFRRMQQGEKITSLALTVNGLKTGELQRLRQLPDLRTLLINVEPGNSLDSLFIILADLPRLEVVGLSTFRGVMIGESEKPLLKLPDNIQKLLRLREIRLSDADFDLDLAFAQLAEMPNLRTLELNSSFSRKTTIPASIGRLIQLTHLRLNRQVTYLPSTLGELRNLKQLTINNQMPTDSGLVQVLPKLTSLEKLNITFVPKTIDGGGTRLSFMMRNGVVRMDDQATLLLNQNTVAVFPILSTLTKLRNLNLDGGNNRMMFPDGIFDGLTQLDTLQLTNFKIGQPLNALCALSGLQFLNLNQNRLTELPACIRQLKQLEVLKVEYDSLKSLPESLAELSHLTHLHLSANQLQALPETIGRLTALRELKLTDNELSVLPVGLGQLKQLETLEIKSNQLTSLPDMGQMANLRSLNVFDNQLTTLPPSLARLTKLRTLVVLGNRLTELPTDIGNLKLLHTLIIDQNNLTALPESIGKLDSLQRLLIGENHLRQLPEGLLNLRNLRELYIGKNQLISLPANIGALRELESFNVADNPLTELPASVGAWTKVKAVSIQFTKIRLLPISIGKWASVTSINVDNNELMALPTEIGQCRQLRRLSVRNANLLGLPESIGRLQQLKELTISGKTDEQRGNTAIGEIQKLPDSLAFCSQLTNLRINHQRELDTWSLYQLLPALTNLRELDLTDCGITDISGVLWAQLPLQRLSLGKNKLMQVPVNLASGPTINWIDLSDNPLPTDFNQPFGNMEQLRTRLVEQAITAGTLLKKLPDVQLMRTFLNQSRQRMEQHLMPEYILADIDRAALFAPDSLVALPEAQRAEVYLMQREYAQAITYYENALAKASLLPAELVENTFFTPTKTKAINQVARWWGNKGVAHGELGQYDKALSALQKGLILLEGLEQTSAAGPLLLAEGRFLAVTQKTKEAQASFAKAITAFQQNDQRSIFAPRRFIKRSSGNATVFLDAESLKQQSTLAALGLITGKPEVTERELTRMASAYSISEIGIYGLVLNYLRACQVVIDGQKTAVQVKEELKKELGERKMEAEGWSFAWLEAAFSTMAISAEKKDALRQLTAIVKERIKQEP